MVYLDRLEKLKNDCEKLARYTKTTDQLGFRMTQNISSLIYGIENGLFTRQDILTLERRFNEYSNEWFENLRDNCEIIRKFSIDRAEEITQELKRIEQDVKTLRRNYARLDNQGKERRRIWYITSVKKLSSRLARLYDKCKMDKIAIRQIIDEISDILK